MNIDLFIAAVLISLASAGFAYAAATWKQKKTSHTKVSDFDIVAVESKIADLAAELNHVANSHANAVEDRKNELKRIIEMANDRIRRLTSILSDIEIIENRIRKSSSAIKNNFNELKSIEAIDSAVLHESPLPLVKETAKSTAKKSLYSEIYKRAANGDTAYNIAESLRIPLNEVEMIINTKERSH